MGLFSKIKAVKNKVSDVKHDITSQVNYAVKHPIKRMQGERPLTTNERKEYRRHVEEEEAEYRRNHPVEVELCSWCKNPIPYNSGSKYFCSSYCNKAEIEHDNR